MLCLGRRMAKEHTRERKILIGTDAVLELLDVGKWTARFVLRSPAGEWRFVLKVGGVQALFPGVTVMVLRIDGGHVRLGFDAPKSVRFHRDEHLSADELADFEKRASTRKSAEPSR